ncbi:hypothetical protein DFH09DRAFT_1287721 [Mycena vulgaris]|nr:hypothetical protein DFH09DRAFT_1287721 [Mycena vulgaris]
MALAWLCLALAQHFPSQGQSQQQARPGQSQWLKPGLERKIFAQQFLRFWGPDEFLGGAKSGHGLTGLAWLGKSQARSQGQGWRPPEINRIVRMVGCVPVHQGNHHISDLGRRKREQGRAPRVNRQSPDRNTEGIPPNRSKLSFTGSRLGGDLDGVGELRELDSKSESVGRVARNGLDIAAGSRSRLRTRATCEVRSSCTTA